MSPLRRILGNASVLLAGQSVNGACTMAYTALAVRTLERAALQGPPTAPPCAS